MCDAETGKELKGVQWVDKEELWLRSERRQWRC